MISRCSHIPSELSPVRQRERLSKELFMSPDRLIYMANQIGKFFESQGQNMAVPASIPKCARPSPRSGTPWWSSPKGRPKSALVRLYTNR